MRLPAMNAPAELRRRIVDAAPLADDRIVVVARGPLVLMAHGLCAVEPPLREDCWIEAEGGMLTAEETMALLHHWTTGAPMGRAV
ncbi:hypothetical protein [Sphingomonas sp. TDK1]|uniref:hypothetical protein n=1 Tax=Sphingomonas sp. TDK1 TaxID=453247 RepID=UPI0007D9F205|nr:hypothetical protein [Sphingomonas sp. TDK1]OAN58871.1 hypothetical protein A7X12_04325 [Sphingomonas sp. TDK1]